MRLPGKFCLSGLVLLIIVIVGQQPSPCSGHLFGGVFIRIGIDAVEPVRQYGHRFQVVLQDRFARWCRCRRRVRYDSACVVFNPAISSLQTDLPYEEFYAGANDGVMMRGVVEISGAPR